MEVTIGASRNCISVVLEVSFWLILSSIRRCLSTRGGFGFFINNDWRCGARKRHLIHLSDIESLT